MSQKISRREFLIGGVAAGGSAFLAACAQTPAVGGLPTATSQPAATATPQPAATATPQPAATATPTAESIPMGGTVHIKGSGGKAKYYSPLWFMGTTAWDNSMPHIWPSLVMFNGEGEATPYLAERFEFSSDAKTLTFHLPESARWSDGHPLTAEDVKFTWESLMRFMPEIGTAWAFISVEQVVGGKEFVDGQADSVSGIQVVDPQTVRFELNTPDVTFVRYLWRSIAPKHMYEGCETFEDFENAPFTQDPTMLHSGPFKLTTYAEAQYIELDAVRPYWVNTPNLHEVKYIDKVIMHQIGNEPAWNMMEAGEVDLWLLAGGEFLDRAASIPFLNEHLLFGYGGDNVILNHCRPFMKDKRVRQAMYYALDREAYNQIAWSGRARVRASPINVPDWALNPNVDRYDYDPDKAKALLEDAGWDSSQELVYLSFTTEGDDLKALWLQQYLAEVGIKVTIRKESYTALAEILATGEFDFWPQGGGGINAHPSQAAGAFSCDSWYGTVDCYCNAALDALVVESRAAVDQQEAQRIAWEMAEILHDELPAMWLLDTPVSYLTHERLGNYIPGPVVVAGATWQMEDWYLKPVED